jgi:hypothetical protein
MKVFLPLVCNEPMQNSSFAITTAEKRMFQPLGEKLHWTLIRSLLQN